MRFFPLAIAEMAGEGMCVAGVDVETSKWVRPVVRGRRCLFADEASQFAPNCVHSIQLGEQQARDHSVDPDSLHTEDHVLLSVKGRDQPVDAATKVRILEQAKDHDLRLAAKSGRRSLFLVEPRQFQYREDTYGKPRFSFPSTLAATHANASGSELAGTRIAVSQSGPPCTCTRWTEFAARTWPDCEISDEDLRSLSSDARLFLLLSLSSLYNDRYWIIAAGVHVIGENRIWL